MDNRPNTLSKEEKKELNTFLLQALPGECVRALNRIGANLEYSQRCLEEEKNGLQAAELRRSLAGAQAAVNQLDRTLDNMFRLMACAQDDPRAEREAVELCGMLRSMCADGEQIYKSIGVRVALDCGGQQAVYVWAERSYLECICLHLLSNALRACKAGGRVCVTLYPGAQEHRLCVADDGCGLPEHAAPGQNREHFVGGTGLGLRLCQEYCRLLGWTLTLEPRPEGGTEAVLTIPALTEAAPAAGRAAFRSGAWEQVRQERLRYAVRRELRTVPGLENTEFED